MQRFCNLGLIETNLDPLLVINEKKLTDYLARTAIAASYHRGSRDDHLQTPPVINHRLFPKRAEHPIAPKGR